MSFDPITAAFDLGKIAIEKIWPDVNKRAEEIRKLEEMRQQGKLAELNAHVQLLLGQIEINKIEAQHKSFFVAGWRPGVGWVATVALALTFIPKALALTSMWVWQCWIMLNAWDGTRTIPTLPMYPDLGVTDLLGLLGSMLGVGAMRSLDKRAGVQTDSIRGGKA